MSCGNPSTIGSTTSRPPSNPSVGPPTYIDEVREKWELAHISEGKEDVDERSEEHIDELVPTAKGQDYHNVRADLADPYAYLFGPETIEKARAWIGTDDFEENEVFLTPVQLVTRSHMTDQGSFRLVLRNPNPRVGELHKRLSGDDTSWQDNAGDWRLQDVRGELAVRTGKARTPAAPGVVLCLAEEYKAGVSAADLARKYRMHKSTVWRHLARAGAETGRHFLADNERLVIEVTALRTAGLALRHIAAHTGISHSSVLRLLRQHRCHGDERRCLTWVR